MPHVGPSSFSLDLLVIYSIRSPAFVVLSVWLSLSLPFLQLRFNAVVPYCACNSVSFSCNQGP